MLTNQPLKSPKKSEITSKNNPQQTLKGRTLPLSAPTLAEDQPPLTLSRTVATIQRRDDTSNQPVSEPLKEWATLQRATNQPPPFAQVPSIVPEVLRSPAVNARAYTVGHQVVQPSGNHLQMKLAVGAAGDVYEQEAERVAEGVIAKKESENHIPNSQELSMVSPKLFLGDSSRQPVQRKVRINGGHTRVNEANYLVGGSLSGIGSRYSVASLIRDNVRRVFNNVAELEGYANGQTDYIGDVKTSTAGTFWYRLPENYLTVLGEEHSNPKGNVEDVILGLQTSRFMYEPFHEFTNVSPLNSFQIGSGTQTRMGQIDSGQRVASLIDRTNFDPQLENIVIKALVGTSATRNEFIAANPATMNATDQQTWGSRPTTHDWSYGERVALYLSMAIHIASDIAQYHFRPQSISNYVDSARILSEFYLANQVVLDNFMTTKDNDDLIGIYNLTATNHFADLPILNNFTLKFHEYAARYIEQLGVQRGNTTLQTEGQALSGNLAATLTTLSPAREEIMWERVQYANANTYLIVGMGDAHRQNLQARLNAAGIRHQEVAQSLVAQQTLINSNWTP